MSATDYNLDVATPEWLDRQRVSTDQSKVILRQSSSARPTLKAEAIALCDVVLIMIALVARERAAADKLAAIVRAKLHDDSLGALGGTDEMIAALKWQPTCTGEHAFGNGTCRRCGYRATGKDFLESVNRMRASLSPEERDELDRGLQQAAEDIAAERGDVS